MEILLLKYKPSCYSNSNCHLQSKNGKDLPDETWKQEKSSFKTKWKKKGIKKEWGKRNHIWLKGALFRSKFISRQSISQKQASVQNFILIWHSVSESCQAKVLMVFAHPVLLPENEWAFVYNFFDATIFSNLFDNPVLLKNVENFFVTDIMTQNWHRYN